MPSTTLYLVTNQINMRHIVSANELDRHNIEEKDGADCNCFPNVEINPLNQDSYVIHKSFSKQYYISPEDVQGIFLFAANDPNYEGGNIIVEENEEENEE